ncbi:MAG TPA: type II toxin-antitoxin system HicB family antitoxin [Mycobacterium sp.]|nr:type II toxin-antitoxin system HicB family antitoxin [Mycobacterium sp.]
MRNYTYRAQWSMESADYVAICLEFPLESARAPTAGEAIARIEQTVAAIVADYEKEDADPPPSLTDRHYSGTFLVRTSPMLHGRLMIESAEQGVSLNHWVVQRLADRGPVPSTDPWF